MERITIKKIAISLFATLGILTAASAQDDSRWQFSIEQPVPTRQVHLDFHTSEHIEGIGESFDKKQFQEAIKLAHLNQINIFAKGHHSWSYFPTEVGYQHPHLDFDLLGAQIEACHEIGVVCPIYFTIGWSENDAIRHPEWCIREKDGKIAMSSPDADLLAKPTDSKPFGGWRGLCATATGEYHQYILKSLEEICKKYEVDGFWLDIYHTRGGCYCESCTKRMVKEGVDINDAAAVERSTARSLKAHMGEVRDLVYKYHPKATVYFNSATHVKDNGLFTERLFDLNTQQEIEDLPTAWGGYDKLPIESKYHLQNGVSAVAMSGKFHTWWGEFGGFKHPDAILYESAAMIAFGASCNFGDQLHPCGAMDMSTYKNIGKAYEYVEKIEDYGPGGRPASRLGLWITLGNSADFGCSNMLLEMQYDFALANRNNLNDYEVIVMPSRGLSSQEDVDAINEWIAAGGKMIVFAEGALSADYSKLNFNVGGEYKGYSEYDADYTVIKSDELSEDVVMTPFLNSQTSVRIEPTSGEVMATIRDPYFSRTYEHFSSHQRTPYKLDDNGYAAIIREGNVIYITHPYDRMYYTSGMRMQRQIFQNALDLLYTKPMLKVNGMQSCGRVSLLKQDAKDRYVAHLLYAPALQRGDVCVIEDLPEVSGVTVEFDVPEKVKSVVSIPSGKRLRFKRSGSKVIVNIPTFSMHTAIVFNY